MSPNRNYIAGRAFEYKIMAQWKAKDNIVMRTAGSHGPFDVIAIDPGHVCTLIQCKRVAKMGQANALIEKWKTNPPIKQGNYHLCLEVYVSEDREQMKVVL
jgi:hypothetical protein